MPIIKQPLPAFTGTIAQPDPNWVTPAGIVSATDPDTEISVQLEATDPFNGSIIYTLKAGILPGFQESFGAMKFLLHADEPEASLVTVNSVTSFGVPLHGTMAITNTESKFGVGSIDNQNKEGYINFGTPASLGLVSSDFSIHGWFNRKANPPGIYELFSNQEKPSNRIAIKVYLDGTSTPVFQLVSSNFTNYYVNGMQPVPLNAWVHIALVRQGNIMYAFVDGVLQGTQTMDSTELRADADGDLFLCASGELGQPVGSLNFNRFNGRVDEFVIELTARWTANFTPPTEPFPLTVTGGGGGGSVDPHASDVVLLLDMEGTSNTPTFIDASPLNLTATTFANSKITNANPKFGLASMEILGNTDARIEFNDPLLNVATASSMTMEGWFYSLSNANWRTTFSGTGGTLYVNAAGNFRWWWASVVMVSSGNLFTTNTWHHVAIVMESSTVAKLYLDGVLVLTRNTGPLSNNLVEIGSVNNGSLYPWNGYIDDVRITRNVARYTANFTPPGPIAPEVIVPTVPGVKLGNDGLLSGNVGPYLGVSGSDLHNFTVTATSNFTNISTDRDFNITVFDTTLNTDWESLWAGSSAQHTIAEPTSAQFEAATPNNVWLSWPNP